MNPIVPLTNYGNPVTSRTPFEIGINDVLTVWSNTLWWLSIPLCVAALPFVLVAGTVVFVYNWVIYGIDVQTLIANTLIVNVDRALLDRRRSEISTRSQDDAELNTNFVRIRTNDNISLDGISVRPIQNLNQEASQQKWIIYFSGVHGNYESYYNSIREISTATQANVLCVNYRGIGRSEGQAMGSSGPISDGRATIQHLLAQGVQRENILFYTHSLGTAIGSAVARDYPEVSIVADRTFESLHAAVRAFIWLPIYQDIVAWLYAKWWNFNSYENLRSLRGRVWLITAHQDFVIAHRDASLFNAYVRRNEPLPETLHLRYHIEPLRSCRERVTDLAMTHSYDVEPQVLTTLISDFLNREQLAPSTEVATV